MAVTRKIKKPDTVVITFAVASIRGHRPLVGFTEEVERAWEQLKRKHRIKNRKSKILQKISSSSQLDNRLNLNDSCSVDYVKGLQRSNTLSDIGKVFIKFRNLEASEIEGKKEDVYSPNYIPKKYSKMDAEYGRPKPGTLSEARAKKASAHIAREMIQLCEVIQEYGKTGKSGKVEITFKDLFDVYTYISDKVVGMLLRARKHNMVDFEGEMLFQRRDDHVIITLLLTSEEIKTAQNNHGNPE